MDRTLSGASTPGQSGPGSDGYEGVFHILQSSSITGASPSDCLMSYPGHYYLPISGGRTNGFMTFFSVLTVSETQAASSRTWTWVVDIIFYDDN